MRRKVQQRLSMALAMANDPATVFCVQPFASVERDGGEHLGRLLARVMGDPDRALCVATDTAFVFAFGDHERENRQNGAEDREAAEARSSAL